MLWGQSVDRPLGVWKAPQVIVIFSKTENCQLDQCVSDLKVLQNSSQGLLQPKLQGLSSRFLCQCLVDVGGAWESVFLNSQVLLLLVPGSHMQGH